MKKMEKSAYLFMVGGAIYWLIEWFFKTFISCGKISFTMFMVGGLCFLIIGSINEFLTFDMSLMFQGYIGCVLITTIELIVGVVLNLVLGLGIWDYSNQPFNFLGQICLTFSFAWFILSIVCVVLDDYLRYWLFNEEKPYYRVF